MVCGFTSRDAAIMTATAKIRGLSVIYGISRYPIGSSMASIAEIGRLRMGLRLIRRPARYAVMTTRGRTSQTGNSGVIEYRVLPRGGGMARVTRQGSGNVGRAFSDSDIAVMTDFAYLVGLAVIEGDD